MEKIEVFLQAEGIKDVILVHLPKGGTVRDLLCAAQEHGLKMDDHEGVFAVFIENAEAPINSESSLEGAGIHHHARVHVHRCHKIQVTVNFNERQIHRVFSPSHTVGQVKMWAAREIGLSEIDATEHALQITGTSERPYEDIHIGTLVSHQNCRISFDLVPKKRVEG